jgi:H+/Cl- antiporter ClcA
MNNARYRGLHNPELGVMILLGIFCILFGWLFVPVWFIVDWLLPKRTRMQQIMDAYGSKAKCTTSELLVRR